MYDPAEDKRRFVAVRREEPVVREAEGDGVPLPIEVADTQTPYRLKHGSGLFELVCHIKESNVYMVRNEKGEVEALNKSTFDWLFEPAPAAAPVTILHHSV